MNTPLPGQKIALRAQLRLRAASLSAAYTRGASDAICRRLLELEAFARARTVFCFVGTAAEIDTRPFLTAVLAAHKTLCVPLCSRAGIMTARRIADLGELEPGTWGIPEPGAQAPLVLPEAIELCVVPCLAADTSCRRLGQGGGYYDRYLPRLGAAACTVLVCREQMLLPAVPQEPHDAVCAMLVTEARCVPRPGPAAI